MAPVVKAFQSASWCRCRVLVTGQHRDLLDGALSFFSIRPDTDLDAMEPDQSLPALMAKLLVSLDEALAAEPPDIVLAQGDTTTVLATALACFYRRGPFGHVEAGLRTGDLAAPFPEEAHRFVAGHLSSIHFAPTENARDNLLAEGIDADAIHVVGNPVIDAMFAARDRQVPLGLELDPSSRLILITAHRRESFGRPLVNICRAVAALAERYGDVEFVWPVHPNPHVEPVVTRLLGGKPRVHLCKPLAYGQFVTAMARSHLILTDSGGLQEEGPALGKPVLVMRDKSARVETVRSGSAELVGTETRSIVSETARLLDDEEAYAVRAKSESLYGDGKAGGRIAAATAEFLGVPPGLARYVPIQPRPAAVTP
jgi:UDP-N-acetylglucosamine 2-epimerase (non-hydrolysing)